MRGHLRHLQARFHQVEDGPLYWLRPCARTEYLRMHPERVDFSAPVPGGSRRLIFRGLPHRRIETFDNPAILLRGKVSFSQTSSDTAPKMYAIGLHQPFVNYSPSERKQHCFRVYRQLLPPYKKIEVIVQCHDGVNFLVLDKDSVFSQISLDVKVACDELAPALNNAQFFVIESFGVLLHKLINQPNVAVQRLSQLEPRL